ncbi:MAG: hypothetical protein U0930_20605 [Pirellulales bacterium]
MRLLLSSGIVSLITSLRDTSSASKKPAEFELPVVFLFPGQGAQYLEMAVIFTCVRLYFAKH